MTYLEPSKLKSLLSARSRKVIERFRQIEFSEVSSVSDLTAVLERTKLQWNEYTRPALISLCCEAVGGKPTDTYDASLAISTFLGGLTIHDDIIDKTKNKHFRDTLLSLESPERALLVGDMLVIQGLLHMIGDFKNAYPRKLSDLIILEISKFIFELFDGEFLEVSFQRDLTPKIDDFLKMKEKLSADVRGCAKIGAMIGGGSTEEVQALTNFGSRLGIVANLADEVKDSLNREGNLSQRLKYESVPLPLLYAAKSSNESKLKVASILNKKRVAANEIRKLCWENKAIDFIYQNAKFNADCAIKELERIKPSSAKSILSSLLMVPMSYIEGEKDWEILFINSL
jgi:geranylgeranyl diphosphate synthase, type I